MLPVRTHPRRYDSGTMLALPRRLTAGLVGLAIVATACSLPELDEERALSPPLAQTSFLFAGDGSLITELHAGENRVVVPLRKIPPVVRDAVVAVEDKRFYEHRGIDARALLRAAYVDVTAGRVLEGGSTITQQYVKNTVVGTDRTLERKVEEAVLAWQLEQDLTKDQILARYLNTVYFGEGAYGIQAAAESFFSKPATDLRLTEAALLAGLISSPADYNPVRHPGEAKRRRNRVLAAMREQGKIGPERFERARHAPLRLQMPPDGQPYPAPYFVDYVKDWFLANPRFGETQQDRYDLLFRGGLRIFTTIDPRLQGLAEEAIDEVLPYATDPRAAMTVLDPRTGEIRAMVGGRNYFSPRDRFAKLNLATGGSTGRQAGSAFKPFALVAALEDGVTPETVYPAPGSLQIPLPYGQVWDVQNYDGASSGSLSVERATVNSVNTVYAQLILDVGPGKVTRVAERMGIRCCRRTAAPDADLQANPAAVLGTNEVNTLEMASAYGTLATGGYHFPPVPVSRIETPTGQVLYEATPKGTLAVEPGVASVAVDILQEAVQYGTGSYANIGRPQFGKTGTAQVWRDAWFVGAVPQLVAAVWAGFPQGQIPMCCGRVRISRVTGGSWPAQIWRAFMVGATEGLPPIEFPTPKVRYVTLAVDVTQGCLPNRYTPPGNIEEQRFIVGTEPKRRCGEPSSYAEVGVPSVIGLGRFEAERVLEQAGFYSTVITQTSSLPAGTVIGQNPPPGTIAQVTSIVRIVVSNGQGAPAPAPEPSPSPEPAPSGKVGVPSVVGMTRASAVNTLEAAGFAVAVVRQRQCDPADAGCDYDPGVIWWQSPAGGVKAAPGSTVTIRVNP